MKSGLIVYLVGDAELPEGLDLAGHCKELGFPADRVELVGSRQGFYAVEDAWHYLFTKGYGNISLLVAQQDQNRLQPLHPQQPLLLLSGTSTISPKPLMLPVLMWASAGIAIAGGMKDVLARNEKGVGKIWRDRLLQVHQTPIHLDGIT